MKRRVASFACALLMASGLIVYGISMVSEPAAYISAGLLLALIAWLALSYE